MRPKFRYSDLKELPLTKTSHREWEKEKGIKHDWVTMEMDEIKSV